MGLSNGQICICGSALGDQDEGVCNLGCLEDELQLCGGVDSISVFTVGMFKFVYCLESEGVMSCCFTKT